MSGPSIDLKQPDRFVGQTSSVDVTLQAPEGRFTHASVTLSQNGKNHDVFTLEPQAGDAKKDASDTLYVIKPIGRKAIPELRSGPAQITVRAARPVLYGLRDVETVVTRDVQVRLERILTNIFTTVSTQLEGRHLPLAAAQALVDVYHPRHFAEYERRRSLLPPHTVGDFEMLHAMRNPRDVRTETESTLNLVRKMGPLLTQAFSGTGAEPAFSMPKAGS